jgi:hypothetical protein
MGQLMRVVQQLEEARSALRAGANDIVTPPNSGCIAGVGYWHAVQEKLREEFPNAGFTLYVDCGDNAAIAHDAMRMGLHVCFYGSDSMHTKLQAIADMQGVKILDKTTG